MKIWIDQHILKLCSQSYSPIDRVSHSSRNRIRISIYRCNKQVIDRCTKLSMVKIATWNVNGLRSLIRDYGNIENVLSLFDGDIVCFQVSFSFEWKHRKVVWVSMIYVQNSFQKGLMCSVVSVLVTVVMLV